MKRRKLKLKVKQSGFTIICAQHSRLQAQQRGSARRVDMRQRILSHLIPLYGEPNLQAMTIVNGFATHRLDCGSHYSGSQSKDCVPTHTQTFTLGTRGRLASASADPAWLQPFDCLVLSLHFTSGDPKSTLGHECVKAEQRHHSNSRKPWTLPTGRRIK